MLELLVLQTIIGTVALFIHELAGNRPIPRNFRRFRGDPDGGSHMPAQDNDVQAVSYRLAA